MNPYDIAGEATDVLVVGAGPAGLSLAINCRRFGLSVRVIDRHPEPDRTSRALAVWSGSLEALSAVGVAEDICAEGLTIGRVTVGDGTRVLLDEETGVDHAGPFPQPVILPQWRTEQILADRLAALGVRVERGVALVAIDQERDRVFATLHHGEDTPERAVAGFVVGCDGGASAVRHLLKIEAEDFSDPETHVFCDGRIEGPLQPGTLYLWSGEGGSIALSPIDGETWRMTARRQAAPPPAPSGSHPGPDADGAATGEPPPEPTPTREEMQHYLTLSGPPGLSIASVSWLAAYRAGEFVAERYRDGRCYLVGDAAHVLSPTGGQGLNMGIMDAANLAWKLAQIARGRGDVQALADSYEAERRPIAKAVIESSLVRLLAGFAGGIVARTTRDVAVKALSRLAPLRRRMLADLADSAASYREGALAGLRRMVTAGTPTVGERALDAPYHDPETGKAGSLWPLLCGLDARETGKSDGPVHTLLLFGDATATRAIALSVEEFGPAVRIVQLDAVTDPDGEAARRYTVDPGGWVLVRPDQVVGTRGGPLDVGLIDSYAELALRLPEAR